MVYTKEAETADQYIEKLAHEIGRKYNVTVATSDGMEQLIIRGQGCRLLSASLFSACRGFSDSQQKEFFAYYETVKILLYYIKPTAHCQ